MKYEIYDMINEEYQYGLTILRVHNKIKHRLIVKALLILPIHNQLIINLIFVIINSMSTITLCSDFNKVEKQDIYLSEFLRLLTPFGWVEKIGIGNFTYIIICAIIMLLCLLRTLYLVYVTIKINQIHITQVYDIKINKFINILNHIVYCIFGYIVQFLSFIFYIEIFPNKFIIKKESNLNSNINTAFMVLNFLFIVIYNCYNYLFIRLGFLQKNKIKFSVQMKVHSIKFYYYIFFQNLSLIQALPYCLGGNATKIWNISFSVFIIIISSIIYLFYAKSFNYNNIINNIISFFGNFCFSSLLLELILYLCSLTYKNYKQLIAFTFIKLIMSISLYYVLDDIYGKIMIRKVKRELFNKDANNFSFDHELMEYILYLREIIINDDPILIRAINYFQLHQNNCQNKYCSCKIIKFAKVDEDNIDTILEYNKKQLIHFMDSIFIKLDYSHNFKLAFILSEHYYIFKKNYIIAYSILQILLHNEYENLDISQLVCIYHNLEKYINAILKLKMDKVHEYKYNNDRQALFEESKEMELKKYFSPILKLKKITKLMIEYSTEKNEIIKQKQNFESTIKVEFDETDGETHSINSQILNQHFITEIVNYLKFEHIQTIDLKKLLYDLKEFKKILSLEFLFKCIIFIDYFWNAKIPEELIEILYGFTNNKNLYSTKITTELYDLLATKFNHENYTTKYYVLIKYTKGLIISYITECLIRKLNLKKENIKNKDLSSLFFKDFITPHNNACNQYYMTKQHSVMHDVKNHFFNNRRYMVENTMDSTFQVGINKNILIICKTQLDEENKSISFFANKNFEIISINQNFENKLNLSLPLIEEFKFEIKDLFDISKKNIMSKFINEIKNMKHIRQFIQLDPREYILKNLFKTKSIKENYKFSDDIIFKTEIADENKENDNESHKLVNRKVRPNFIKMIHKIYNNEIIDSFANKSVNFTINKSIVVNKMRKMMEKISLYEQGKLETKNLYQDYLRFHQNYDLDIDASNVFINLNITMKLLYDTPFYLCKIQQFENNILSKENFCFWENTMQNSDSENSSSNSQLNLKEDDMINNVLMDRCLNTNTSQLLDKKENGEENNESNGQKNQRESLENIRKRLKKKTVPISILRFVEILFILALLVMYIIILSKKLNLITQADSIFKTLFYTYYQRAQLLYINSVVLSIHFNLVNITDIDSLKENTEMLRKLSENLEEGFHLFYKYYLKYKEGLNEDVEELYRQRAIYRLTINWEAERKMTDYIKEMQVILYMAMQNSESENYTEGDVLDCEHFLLGNFINNTNNNMTDIHGNLIRLIYYLYSNYDTVFRIFFEELTASFESSFRKFSNGTILNFLLLETAGLIIYVLFFIINFYFLYQANKYIFQNILCLFLDFTQKDSYSFNNKSDNLLIRKCIKNYISLLTEFTPKKLEALTNGVLFNKDPFKLPSKEELNDTISSENKKDEIFKNRLKEKKDTLTKKLRSNSTLKARFSIINMDKKLDVIDKSHDIHGLNNSNLSKIYSKKETSRKIKEILSDKNSTNTKSNRTNNTTFDKNQNNSSILNMNTSIMDQSKTNILFNQSKNSISVNSSYNNNNNLNIEKVILISRPIMIRMVKVILVIFVLLSVIYVVIYIVSVIIGFMIINEIRNMYIDFRVLVSQYNEVIHYWNNMKTLFIIPSTKTETDIYNIEKYFSSINTEVLNVLATRIGNYKRVKVLYNYLFNSHTQQELINANFCEGSYKCFELINSTQNVLLNGLNSAVALYEKAIYNYYQDFIKVKDTLTTKEAIKSNFIKDNFIILGMNINHLLSHLEEKFFRDFLEDENDIADNYHIEIKVFSLVSLFYCIILNIYSLIFIFSYVNKNIEFIESSTLRIISSFCHMKKKIQNIIN